MVVRAFGKGAQTVARLEISIRVVDDAGDEPLHVEIVEPSRLDPWRDPLFSFTRLEAATHRALDQLHRQALVLARGHGGTHSGIVR